VASRQFAITPKVSSHITAMPVTDNQHVPAAADQMDMPTFEAPTQAPREKPNGRMPAPSRVTAIIVAVVVAAVAGLSIWYLVRPDPLLVQGEVDATRLDIAARVDGRVGDIPVERGQDVAAGAVLVRIDNPETLATYQQALAAKGVAEAQLANINAGTRPEIIAARKAALERSQASVVLAQKTFDRANKLAEYGYAPQDQVTAALRESQQTQDSPNPPTSKPSTAIPRRIARSPWQTSRRRTPISRLLNPSSSR
jgi:HlyD family secretion protein